MGRVCCWRGSLLQQRVDRKRVANADALSDSTATRKADREWARMSGAVGESERPSDGKSGPGGRVMGGGGHPEKIASVEVAGRNARGNSLRSLHWDSGFGGTTPRQDSNRVGRRIPANQGQSETRMGREYPRTDPFAMG